MRFLCWLGFHRYIKYIRLIARMKIQERVCIRCGYCPTWNR